MKLKSLSTVLVLLQLCSLCVSGELLMSVWIVRHGARQPLSSCNELLELYGGSFEGHRALTNVGMRQHYLMGRAFQEMYKGKANISPDALLVRATSNDRTFMSGMSFLYGATHNVQSTHKLLVLFFIQNVRVVK